MSHGTAVGQAEQLLNSNVSRTTIVEEVEAFVHQRQGRMETLTSNCAREYRVQVDGAWCNCCAVSAIFSNSFRHLNGFQRRKLAHVLLLRIASEETV